MLTRPSFNLEIIGTGNAKAQFTLTTISGTATIRSTTVIPYDTWVHVAAVYDRSNISLYINGQLEPDQKPLTGTVVHQANDIVIADNGYEGLMEELRLSNTARSITSGSVSNEFG